MSRTVAVILDGDGDIVRVFENKTQAENFLKKVKAYKKDHEYEFSDHWYMDIYVPECKILVYEVWKK